MKIKTFALLSGCVAAVTAWAVPGEIVRHEIAENTAYPLMVVALTYLFMVYTLTALLHKLEQRLAR